MTRSLTSRTHLRAHLVIAAAGAVAILSAASCSEFDPELYKNAENITTGGTAGTTGTGATGGNSGGGNSGGGTAGSGGASGGGGAPTGGGGAPTGGGGTGAVDAGPTNWDKISDWCPVPDANLLTSSQTVHSGSYALNELVSDVAEVPKVPGLGGPDGVIGFKVAAEQRVSVRYDFHKGPGETAPDVDLVAYLLSSCDANAFIRRNDRCPKGQGEDLWWQMNDAASTYYLGFDAKDYDTKALDPRIKLTVSYPLYGNNVIEEGEACDDGNKADGDGCTKDGLFELKYDPSIVAEKEPNNHPFGGNVLKMGVGQTMTISATTAGTCDNDFFAFDVPQGAFPRVTMLSFNGGDCDATVGTITMQFNRLDGTKNVEQVKLGDGKPVGTNKCPSWTETSLGLGGLAAGRYVAEIKGFEVGKATVPYRLKVELVQLGGADAGTD